MSEKRSFLALDWVNEEIAETISQTKTALQGFIENTEDVTRLRFCLTYVHQVTGSLKMVELHGAALLAGEIEYLIKNLLDEKIAAEKVQSVCEQIYKSLTELDDYVKLVSQTRQDRPKALIETVNRIRELNEQEAITRAEVFNPDVTPAHQANVAKPTIEVDEFNELIRKMRQGFQKGLIGVVRDQNLTENLVLIQKVCASIYKVSKGTASEPLWQVAYAIAESLQQHGQADLDAKKSLKQIDNELKRLEENGRDELTHSPDSSALKALLYSIATAAIETPLVLSLRQQYNLVQALEEDSQEDAAVKPPSDKFLYVVSALQKDLKEFAASVQNGSLLEVLGVGSRIQSTIDLLGLTTLMEEWQEVYGYIKDLNANTGAIDEASVLLEQLEEVEKRLASIREYHTSGINYDESAFIDRVKTIAANGQNGLEEIKERIVEYVATQWQKDCILPVPALINAQLPALNISPFASLQAILDAASRYVQEQLIDSAQQPEWSSVESLADVISSVEYYLECALGESAANLESIYQVAVESLQALHYTPAESLHIVSEIALPAVESLSIEPAGSGENDASFDSTDAATETEDGNDEVTELSVLPEDIDEDILDIFIEEGGEVLENIKEYLPQLKNDRNNKDVLTEIRRSYHTLKGSGRMVGAEDIGEFAWSVERMLNKVMDGDAVLTDNCLQIVSDATAIIPTLLEALTQKKGVSKKLLNGVINRATAEWKGVAVVTASPVQEEAEEDILDQDVEDFVVEEISIAEPEPEAPEDIPAAIEADEEFALDLVEDEAESEEFISLEQDDVQNEYIEPIDEPLAAAFEEASLESEAVEENVAADVVTADEAEVEFTELPEDIDEDILEIFIEEGGDVLTNIRENLPSLKQDKSNTDALTEVRRSYHTLKGSGRMVGAADIGEFAWSVERMLNKVMDGGAPLTDNAISIVEAATNLIPMLLEALEQRKGVSKQILATVVERADAEWQGKAIAPAPVPAVEEEELLLEEAYEAVSEIDVINDSTDVVDDGIDIAEELVDGFDDDTEPEQDVVELAAPVAEFDEMDEGLLEIFVAEAESHISTFTEFLDNIEPGYEDVLVSADLQRALHTLKGSAYMAEVNNIAELVTPLESFVKDLNNFQIKLDSEILSMFMRAVELLHVQLENLKNGSMEQLPEAVVLAKEIQTLHQSRIETIEQGSVETATVSDKYTALLSDALESMTIAADLIQVWQLDSISEEQQQELCHYVQRLSDTAHEANYPEVSALASALAGYYTKAINDHVEFNEGFFALANKAHEELDDMMDVIAAQQVVEAADALIVELNSAFDRNEIDNLASELNDIASSLELEDDSFEAEADVEFEIETVALPQVEGIAVDLRAFARELQASDQETLEIFMEEAGELFEQLDECAHNWFADRSSHEPAAELKRILHTLKGGARLAELSMLGNLTHDYESMIESAEIKHAFDDAFFNRSQAYLSAIQQLVEFALSGGDVSQIPTSNVTETLIGDVGEVTDTPTTANVHSFDIQTLLQTLEAEYKAADEDTLEIFIEEAGELMAGLEETGQHWLAARDQHQHADELKRLLHTLKGGARLAELGVLGTLAHDYESMIESVEVSKNFDDSFFANVQVYQDGLQKLVDYVVKGAGSDQQSPTPALESTLIAMPEIEPVQPAVDTSMLVDTARVKTEDEEVLELFVDEAKDQVEGIEECIAQYLKDNSDISQLDELKRFLHTLKGGARMANVASIGDLSHDFETYVINAERDGSTQDENFIDQLQAFHEQLNVQVQQLVSDQGASEQKSAQVSSNVVPIRPDIDPQTTAVKISQAAIDATRNFIENFNKEQQRSNREPVKIQPEVLEGLINLAGEISIGRSRVEEQMNELVGSQEEMDATVDRLHEQLRRLEIETEAQISFRTEQIGEESESFDPLEMDRYTNMQQLSKSLIESASDLDDISATFTNKMREMETLLIQQSRTQSELQEGLMRCQMVPFSRMVPRLRRIVRQVAGELGKKVDFHVENAEGELDRTILERMVAPLEHMLRNAVDHGIEMPDVREQAGKSDKGEIVLALSREGGEVVITLRDNGAGVNLQAVRKKAIERGLMKADAPLSDHEISQFILHAGFSTAEKVTQISGRGVGMDVVHSEIKQMGGSVEIDSVQGKGTTFIVRLPFTVSVNRALMVCIGTDTFAIPLNTIEGIVRVSPYELEAYYQPDAPLFEYAGQQYNLRYLGNLLRRTEKAVLEGMTMPLPVILIRSADYSVAVQVDRLLGSQEVVVKSLGPQFSMVEGLSGATVLGNGSVVIILDMLSMIRADFSRGLAADDSIAGDYAVAEARRVTKVMVTDDSVTVRKVTSRLLERHGLEVVLAKDGLDAITQLQEMEHLPDIMLLDIEMPRMDGFEVVSRVRHNNRLQHIPICMITSRTGDKHRERAIGLGASEYLGKPFQERELLETISRLTGAEVLHA